MSISGKEPLKDLEILIEKGNLNIERSKKLTFKDYYMEIVHRISKKPVRVAVPTVMDDENRLKGLITEIPKIAENYIDEVEIASVLDPYSYVRIKFDNISSEYLYEVIEPSLTEDEAILLEMLKNSVVLTINKADMSNDREKETILRTVTDELLKTMEVNLNMDSRERIHYYLRRDFIGYAAIDPMMLDLNVEDCSCDGVNVPLYIFHRKYGSIKSNVKFETDEELDAFVVWLAQKCGKHISVAEPMLDATIPDGSRLNATLGKHVTKRGSSFTIRRFKENPFTPVDLLRFKTMSTEMMA
ncbi:MAG: secretion system protein E, partial [Methanomassiliicoccales archaeon]|nr:secretion system protein E [Methanomassiliicoccales archaeon]